MDSNLVLSLKLGLATNHKCNTNQSYREVASLSSLRGCSVSNSRIDSPLRELFDNVVLWWSLNCPIVVTK